MDLYRKEVQVRSIVIGAPCCLRRRNIVFILGFFFDSSRQSPSIAIPFAIYQRQCALTLQRFFALKQATFLIYLFADSGI